MARPRSVCFTLNNYTLIELNHIKDGSFKFIIFQEETGAGGTPHLQGYAQLAQPTTFIRWKQLLGTRCHLEAAKGNAESNIAYCTKESDRIAGTRVFERGLRPVQGERNDLTAICNAAMDPTVTLTECIALDCPNFLRFNRGVMVVKSLLAPKRRFKTEVFWFYGATGTRKSTRARLLAGERSFWKQNSPWWCGYDPLFDETVVIDEYRCDFSKFAFLLQLFDEFPLQVQVKGANLQFSARRIIVTSPKSPSETWATRTPEDVQQLLRRITVVCEFFHGGITRFHKGTADLLVDIQPLVQVEQVGSVSVAAEPEPTFERTVRARTGPQLADEPPILSLSQSSFLCEFDFDNEQGNNYDNNGLAHVEHFNI